MAMTRWRVYACLVLLAAAGCGGGGGIDLGGLISSEPAAPRATLKRVPLRLKLGPIGAALEVDLGELKNIALDATEIYGQIVAGQPSDRSPSRGLPVLTVINKRDNKFTYFTLSQNVKQVTIRTGPSDSVQLVLKNEEPLQVELWVDTEDEIDLDVEFKDGLSDEA